MFLAKITKKFYAITSLLGKLICIRKVKDFLSDKLFNFNHKII